MDARELLVRYARGEKSFDGVNLHGANLQSAILVGASFRGAHFEGANLQQAHLEGSILTGAHFLSAHLQGAFLNSSYLEEAHLEMANLEAAHLDEAHLEEAHLELANLRRAQLSGANLVRVDFAGADLGQSILQGAQLLGTQLVDVDLKAFCDAELVHYGASTVDYRSIIKSAACASLVQFLRDTGMPQMFIGNMVDCARALTQEERFSVMLSTFISYGGPDEPFAHELNEALQANGVRTFFYPLNAEPGEWNAKVMHKGILEHDRVVVVCSNLLYHELECGLN